MLCTDWYSRNVQLLQCNIARIAILINNYFFPPHFFASPQPEAQKFCQGRLSAASWVRKSRGLEKWAWQKVAIFRQSRSGASTSIQNYAQCVLLFSRGTSYRTSKDAVNVPPELDQKCFVSLKMHQIHFRSGLRPVLQQKIVLEKFSTGIHEYGCRRRGKFST